jgi:hypothetical protein
MDSSTGPTYIATIDQLMSLQQVVTNQETIDTANLQAIFVTPSESSFQTQLTTWATLNFPVSYPIASIQLTPPAVCSDGISRNYIQYALFCLQAASLDVVIAQLQLQFLGITLSYTYSDPAIISLVVTKN